MAATSGAVLPKAGVQVRVVGARGAARLAVGEAELGEV